MTRRLSDIGKLVKPDPDSLTQFEPYYMLTREERREFAYELIRAWERLIHDDLVGGEYVEEFLEEQRL